MKYDMSTPCVHCPFRSDIRGYLCPERAEEIAESVLSGGFFPCHKTTVSVEDDEGESDLVAGDDSQECAGAAIFAAKHGCSSQMSRIAERLGFQVAKLDMSAPVCDTVEQMVDIHNDW